MATIRDVAKASGVSVTTVSFVLNNSPRPVSAETRRRVSEVARRLNYHPNAVARGLVQRRMNSLGVLFSAVESAIVTNNYATSVLGGVFTEASARGYDVHLYTRAWENAEVSAPRFRDRQTDGTLVIAPIIGSDMVSGLDALNIPIVVVSTPITLPNVPFVDVDNAAGARIAAEHLLSLGHRRIAHLLGAPIQQSVFARRDTFLDTLAAHGVTLPPEYLIGNTFATEDAYAAVRAVLALPTPPTALFCSTDDLAYAALRAARDAGVAVPEQFSIIGFDDHPLAAEWQPGLTTIHHPLRSIGRKATSLLIDRIENPDAEVECCHLFTPELVVRASTAPAS